MASKSKKTKLVRLNSTGTKKDGKVTGFFYTTTSTKTKLELSKYDPRAYNPNTGKNGMHVIFKEGKIK